jgi:uncharacterized protein (DUF488 family)
MTDMPRIYTIGYGNTQLHDFISTLQRFGVKLLADVRSFPTSKWPDYRKENLELELPKNGIAYAHIKELGGFRKGGYANFLKTREFKIGLEKLVKLAEDKTTAMMCVERSPTACHRRFIAKKLEELGWEVIHIKYGRRLTQGAEPHSQPHSG